uniref:Low density lipoprotein receptor class A domain containing 1 n=1 Tax=Cyanistes caeruleus TaxID=156563 RepID=A0A8C0UK05_CYACU
SIPCITKILENKYFLAFPTVSRFCTAPNNKTGFLCDDRVTCVPASWVCDRVSNCRNGEDEQEQLCGDLPHSLPGYLVFYCSNPRSWVYADQRCNGMNDCGDCSDETWSCKSVCWLLSFLLRGCNSLCRCGARGCCWQCLEAGIHH